MVSINSLITVVNDYFIKQNIFYVVNVKVIEYTFTSHNVLSIEVVVVQTVVRNNGLIK